MHYSICYVSTVQSEATEHEIHKILKLSKENNNRNAITGILLYSDGNFFQIIEGDKEKILNVYDKIEKDPRHQNIIKILEKPVHKDSLEGYESKFIAVNAYYSKERFEHYLDYVKVLDLPSQKAVINIMHAFIKD